MNRICSAALLALGLIAAPIPPAQAQTAQETLRQYVSDLQKNPADTALRERIIQHVQKMKRAPAIPEEARRHYVKGSALFKTATRPSDSADAAEEFRQALLIAPWWGEAYMKMGLALEAAQRYDDAIVALKLFMATAPSAEVQRQAQDEIYSIEAMRDKAAKDQVEAERRQQAAQAEADAREQQRKADDLYRKCDGKRNVWHWEESIDSWSVDETADLRGSQIILGSVYKSGRNIPSNMQRGVWKEMWDLRISRKELDAGRLVLYFDSSNNNWMYEKAYLNDDCEIKFRFKHGDDSGYYIPSSQ